MRRVPRPCRGQQDGSKDEKKKKPQKMPSVAAVRNVNVNNDLDSPAVHKLPPSLGSAASILPERVPSGNDKTCAKVVLPPPVALDAPALLSVHRVGENVLAARSDLGAANAASGAYASSGGAASLAGLAKARGVDLLADKEQEVEEAGVAALKALNFGPDESIFNNLQSLKISEREFARKMSRQHRGPAKTGGIRGAPKRDPVPGLEEDFGFVPYQGEEAVPDLRKDGKRVRRRQERAREQRIREKYSYKALSERDSERMKENLEEERKMKHYFL